MTSKDAALQKAMIKILGKLDEIIISQRRIESATVGKASDNQESAEAQAKAAEVPDGFFGSISSLILSSPKRAEPAGTFHEKEAHVPPPLLLDASPSPITPKNQQQLFAVAGRNSATLESFPGGSDPDNPLDYGLVSASPSAFGSEGGQWPATITLRSHFRDIPEVDFSTLASLTSGFNNQLNTGAAGSVPKPHAAKRLHRMTLSELDVPAHHFRSAFLANMFSSVDPNSPRMVSFDVIGICVLLHDIIISSYVFALDVEVKGIMLILSWLATCYWTCDFTLRWRTGFYAGGELVMIGSLIRRHYMRSWCILDTIMLLCDYSAVFFHFNEDQPNAGAVVRLAKFVRLLRLFRIARLARLMDTILELNWSQRARSYIRGTHVVVGVLIYNHLVSCAWCAVGRTISTKEGISWLDHPAFGKVEVHGADEITLRDLSPPSLYLSSLHWTLSQMTPGPNPITACTDFEKVFNIVLLVIGLLFTSFIVSLFSGQLMQHILKRRLKSQQIDVTRRFLKQHNISTSLSARVQRQVLGRMHDESRLTVKDVPTFSLLSAPLQHELLREIRLPHLLSHDIFRVWSSMDDHDVVIVCIEAVDNHFVMANEELFAPKSSATAAHYVISGHLEYTIHPRLCRAMLTDEVKEQVWSEVWVTEAALWVIWQHEGKMESVSSCQLLRVDAARLAAVMERCGPAAFVVKQYAVNYHRRLVMAVPPHAEYPNDLVVPYTMVSSLLSFHVSLAIFEQALLTGTLKMTEVQARAMRKEISNQVCFVNQAEGGRLERILGIAVLRVQQLSAPAFFLAQVGELVQGSVTVARVLLPASKLGAGEAPKQGLDRLTSKMMGTLFEDLDLLGTEEEESSEESERYGMRTVYRKVVHRAYARPLHLLEGLFFGPDDLATCPLGDRHFYQLPSKRNVQLFTWLTQDEFDFLKVEGAAEWLSWLQQKWLPMKEI